MTERRRTAADTAVAAGVGATLVVGGTAAGENRNAALAVVLWITMAVAAVVVRVARLAGRQAGALGVLAVGIAALAAARATAADAVATLPREVPRLRSLTK
jgi:hypothetical protein